jgi:hypothetical protein
MHPNGFEFQPTLNLNRYLREYGTVCLSSTTPAPPEGSNNVVFQTDSKGNISANYVPGGGSGGGVNPGEQLQLPFYAENGSVVSATSITTNIEGTTLTVPGLLTSGQDVSSSTFVSPSGVFGPFGSGFIQSTISLNVVGSGWSLGNEGGWSVAFGDVVEVSVARRGITQLRSGQINKQAVGDTAAISAVTISDGGATASSDEGCVGVRGQMFESTGYFHGTVTTTSGTGDIAPVLAFSSGNAWTTDGAFLLNISKGTISGSLNGDSVATTFITNSGPVVPNYAFNLPVTGVTLPISTAIGITTAPIADQNVTADSPALTTVVVNLVSIGGVFKTFTPGSIVSVAGMQYPEQSKIITATDSGTNQQTLTLKLRNPNTQAIIFQGGIQGQYISFDANLAFSGMRSSYYAFGSLTGSDLIYGFQAFGSIANNMLPLTGSEAATNTGSGSGFHLYPGAEVVSNTSLGFACVVEQNGVHWAPTDAVENPHNPSFAGGAAFFVANYETPSNPNAETSIMELIGSGPGFAGASTSAILVQNESAPNNYLANGGPLTAPSGMRFTGSYNNLLSFSAAPDSLSNGSVVFVSSPANTSAPDTQINVINLDWSEAGKLTFQSDTLSGDGKSGLWTFTGSVASTGYSINTDTGGFTGVGTALDPVTFTSADGKTVTVIGGIITNVA